MVPLNEQVSLTSIRSYYSPFLSWLVLCLSFLGAFVFGIPWFYYNMKISGSTYIYIYFFFFFFSLRFRVHLSPENSIFHQPWKTLNQPLALKMLLLLFLISPSGLLSIYWSFWFYSLHFKTLFMFSCATFEVNLFSTSLILPSCMTYLLFKPLIKFLVLRIIFCISRHFFFQLVYSFFKISCSFFNVLSFSLRCWIFPLYIQFIKSLILSFYHFNILKV